MPYIDPAKLIHLMFTNQRLDSKALLGDIDRTAHQRVMQRSKDGVPGALTFTNATMEEKNFATLPSRDKKLILKIRNQLQSAPEKSISQLLKLKELYPNVPIIHQFLGIAYFYNHQHDRHYEIIMETIRKFPEYLFGKTSLMDYHIMHNEHTKIREILGGKFEMRDHWPEVEIFHVSEVRAFFCPVGSYFVHVNNLTRALYHYFVLRNIDPDHITTQRLGDEILLKEIDNLGIMPSLKKRRKKAQKTV